jgi:nitrogen-specific signal transduction histidine kinase
MTRKTNSTQFAPAERTSDLVLSQQSYILGNESSLIEILNAISTFVVILNKERQIVFGNKSFLDFLEKKDLADITGQRVGEVMGCVNSTKTDGGCGTTDFCSMCGAVNAMLNAQDGKVDVQECRITVDDESRAFDLRVMAAPFDIKGDEFTVFSILDIADEKRKDVLERIFMHDLLNIAGGLRGFSRLLSSATEDELTRYSFIVNELAERLVNEIEAHKELMQAENHELEVQAKSISTRELLLRVREIYLNHNVAKERSIVIDPAAEEHPMQSDESLLTRVLGNMLKNALEAISPGETVTISCCRKGELIRFSVKNPGMIPKNVGLQIFQRSFSTKGSGRGLGTYSMKLLSEQYLKGKVGFSSSAEKGTHFFGEYPLSI